MIITIDPYYEIGFYNECLEALQNNRVQFHEYIDTKAPYNWYIEVPTPPTFLNYDDVNTSRSRYLVNLVQPLRPSDDYKYRRRSSFSDKKALEHYAINDAFSAVDESGQGIMFTATKDEVLNFSKEYPRKVWFLGRYFNRRYVIFMIDSMFGEAYLRNDQILVKSSSFKSPTELEVELNYKVFHLNDRLTKLSETPYVQNGVIHPLTIRTEFKDKYKITK